MLQEEIYQLSTLFQELEKERQTHSQKEEHTHKYTNTHTPFHPRTFRNTHTIVYSCKLAALAFIVCTHSYEQLLCLFFDGNPNQMLG